MVSGGRIRTGGVLSAGSRVGGSQTPPGHPSHGRVSPQPAQPPACLVTQRALLEPSCGDGEGTLTRTPLGTALPVLLLWALAGCSPEEGPRADTLPSLRAAPTADTAAPPQCPGLPLPIHCRARQVRSTGPGRGGRRSRSHGGQRHGAMGTGSTGRARQHRDGDTGRARHAEPRDPGRGQESVRREEIETRGGETGAQVGTEKTSASCALVPPDHPHFPWSPPRPHGHRPGPTVSPRGLCPSSMAHTCHAPTHRPWA